MSSRQIKRWAEFLRRVEGAELWPKCSSFVDEPIRERCAAAFASHGVAPARVRLIPKAASTREHLHLYGRMDIGLDLFPYNGTTTACEALWMGAAVVTLRGDRHAGRVGASLLTRVGLEEWIAETPDQYVQIAASWAGKLEERGGHHASDGTPSQAPGDLRPHSPVGAPSLLYWLPRARGLHLLRRRQ